MSRIFALSSRKNVGYDVPLHLKLGTEFLVLLITLMSFLSILALIGVVSLGHMTKSWTSGLENSITIEIPAANISEDNIKSLLEGLRKIDGVQQAQRLSQKDMQDMLSPWLGDVSGLWDDLPVPALITVNIRERSTLITSEITATTRRLLPDANVDAHEEWLHDLLKLANGLRLLSFSVFCLIMLVTAAVVGGAVRSRMAIHHRELELLHIMGASDSYITHQFVRYIFVQSLKGVCIGILLGFATIGTFGLLSHKNPGTLPDISLSGSEWGLFVVVPLLLSLIGVWAARITALRVLREMP